MAHLSLSSLQAEIAAQAGAAYRAGVRFYVVCEGADGRWFALHADDQGHAGALARHWVDVLGCRGADCYRLQPWGGNQPFFQYFEAVEWPEDFSHGAEVIDA